MLKVFLVEDEFVVREGIKNNIDWTSEGFRFCGEAADGELAFPLIQSEQPDIVITDIRMPFMDGLELSRLLKKELPQCKIIILSGYEEFSYAQEAIKIGVTEYLLKPLSSAELIRTVKRVAQQVINEHTERENLERYKREMEENTIDMKRKFFNRIIDGSLSTAKILELGSELGIDLGAQYYQLVLLKFGIIGHDEAYSSEMANLNNEIKNINSYFENIIVFDRAIEGYALLIKGDSLEQIDSSRREYIARIKTAFERYPRVRFFGGIGEEKNRLTLLSESYESAARAFAHRFILDKNLIVSSMQISRGELGDGFDSSLDTSELEGLDLKKAVAFLKNGEADEVNFFVDEFLKNIEGVNKKSLMFRQYILINMYITVLTFLKELGITNINIEEPFKDTEQMYEKIEDSSKAAAYLKRIISAAIESRDIVRTRHYHRIIEKAMEYIDSHYADEEISLNDTAAYVNISPNHFSAVFSRETGKSFIKYLTDLRMNKAKEMLKCTDLRCSDISMAVGYKDPHYFSYLFKKLQNCTPMQYRTSMNQF